MKRLSVLLASAALGATAQAATVSYQFGLPIDQSLTEIQETGLLVLFDPLLGTLDSVSLAYSSVGSTTLTLTNASAQERSARATLTMNMRWSSTLLALDALLSDQQLRFSTGASIAYAADQSRSFGPLGDAVDSLADLSGILPALTGIGTFPVTCATLTSLDVSGGGGDVRASQNTTAGCGARITYTYTRNVVDTVPEPASLALVAVALAGLGAAGRQARRRAASSRPPASISAQVPGSGTAVSM